MNNLFILVVETRTIPGDEKSSDDVMATQSNVKARSDYCCFEYCPSNFPICCDCNSDKLTSCCATDRKHCTDCDSKSGIPATLYIVLKVNDQ